MARQRRVGLRGLRLLAPLQSEVDRDEHRHESQQRQVPENDVIAKVSGSSV